MNRLVLILAAIGAVVWSLLAWAAHALVGTVGGLAATNADWLPLPPEWVVFVANLIGPLTGVGLFGVVLVWILGLLAIAAIAFVLRLILGAGRADGGHRPGRGRLSTLARDPRWRQTIHRLVRERHR